MLATRGILEQLLFICNLPELGMGRKRPGVAAGPLLCISSPKARTREKAPQEPHVPWVRPVGCPVSHDHPTSSEDPVEQVGMLSKEKMGVPSF